MQHPAKTPPDDETASGLPFVLAALLLALLCLCVVLLWPVEVLP